MSVLCFDVVALRLHAVHHERRVLLLLLINALILVRQVGVPQDGGAQRLAPLSLPDSTQHLCDAVAVERRLLAVPQKVR